MTPLLHPTLVNGPFGDPGLYVETLFERWSLLFDVGDMTALSPRKLLRIGHVFVSHTHMDHFAGFDRLLRILVGRERTVRLFGPAGFIDRVEHRLAAYTWNLVDKFDSDLVFRVTEVHGPDFGRSATLRLKNAFRREAEEEATLAAGLLVRHAGFSVSCAVLDHGTPCLGFAVEEDLHVNVWRNRLDEQGLAAGPWLRELKQAVRDRLPDDTPVPVAWRGGSSAGPATLPLGGLKRQVLSTEPGQKFAYVVDVAGTPANASRIAELARDADILFIEAAFAAAEAERALDRAHLTTAQAGAIARMAQAGRVEPFHFSPRYAGQEDRLRQEVEAAFRAGAAPV